MTEHTHITRSDTVGCSVCDKLAGRHREPEPVTDDHEAPDLSAFPEAQHRIERGKFVCPGDSNARCHRYPGDDCDHDVWTCEHEFVGHAECWVKPWIDASVLADSCGDESMIDRSDDEFPDGDVTWTWEGDYVLWEYGTNQENGSRDA